MYIFFHWGEGRQLFSNTHQLLRHAQPRRHAGDEAAREEREECFWCEADQAWLLPRLIKWFSVHQRYQIFYKYVTYYRDMLIWQIEEFLYPTSILGMIYHIRADAFIFFGLWCSQKRTIQPNLGVKLNNSIHQDWITFRLHKLSLFTVLHWMTVTFGSIPLWKVVHWNPIIG